MEDGRAEVWWTHMVEVLWVAIFGAVLAWLQARSNLEPKRVEVPTEDAWDRWEEEIHDWRDTA